MLPVYFVYIGSAISFLGGLRYVSDVLKGNNRPNRVSWFMWTLAPMIAFASQIHQGVGPQAVLTFTAGFNPLLVVVATFISKKAIWKISKFDVICGSLSLLGLVLWLSTNTPNVAILFSILADAAAAIPTVVKSFKDPDSESSTAFVTSIIAAILTLLTIHEWKFQNYAFSVYVAVICITISVLVSLRVGPRLRSRRLHTHDA